MNVLIWILTFVHVVVALVLILLVLMKKSQDQGVGAAFGGGMTETVFGAGTTTALVRMTIWCAAIMLGTTLLLAVLHSRRSHTGESLGSKVLNAAPEFDDCQKLASEKNVPLKQVMAAAQAAYAKRIE